MDVHLTKEKTDSERLNTYSGSHKIRGRAETKLRSVALNSCTFSVHFEGMVGWAC